MNILLTGGTGYIGSHTAVVLTQAGHRVVLYDNLCNSGVSVVDSLARITGQRPVFVEGDIRNTELLIQTFRASAIDAVIHFAGLKAVGESIENPLDYYANNVQGTINLLQAMQAVQISTLVFSSSATVYGEPKYLPLDENHPTCATNPYGRSKLHIEEMLADVARCDEGWRIACLRYFNPVGAHESALIGEDPCGIPNNLMPFLAQVAAGQRPELKVFGNDYPTPDGTGVRDYLHVMDLADGHLAALDYLRTHVGWHAINLGTGKGRSVLEMIHAFERACGRPVPYQVVSRRPGDVAACYAKVDKAAHDLRWSAKRSLADMCRSTWEFQRKSESG